MHPLLADARRVSLVRLYSRREAGFDALALSGERVSCRKIELYVSRRGAKSVCRLCYQRGAQNCRADKCFQSMCWIKWDEGLGHSFLGTGRENAAANSGKAIHNLYDVP